MKKTLFFLVGYSLILLSSCRKENDLQLQDTVNQVNFSTSIAGLPQSRANGAAWDASDSIGIFMFQHGAVLSPNSLLSGGDNRPYITIGNGNFSLKRGDELLFPVEEQVDFAAYYPYQPGAGTQISLTIQEQDNQPALDFMQARNTAGRSAGQGPVSLRFERQMAKVELRVQVANPEGLTATFLGMPAKASYDLSSHTLQLDAEHQDIAAKVSVTSDGAVLVQWTLFPGTVQENNKIVFRTAAGKSYTWTLEAGTQYLKGHRYQYDVVLGDDGAVAPTPTASYMELPVIKEGTDLKYSMKMSTSTRRNYSMLYDSKNKVANWVAYPLSKDYLGSQDRTDHWAYDPDFLQNLQADLHKGYPNNAGLDIDRGHQIPSGDRTANYAENATTFYYTNMTPQAKRLNQGLWANLENKIRNWATVQDGGADTLYVVTGAVIQTSEDQTITYVKDNNGQDVAKPKYYYKALAMKKGSNYYTIGFRIDNETPSKSNYMDYTTTVKALEEETGYTFFPALSESVKSTIDTKIWRY